MIYFIFTLAFLIRVIVQYFIGSFTAPDTCEFEIIANNFLAGRGLVYDIYGTVYYSMVTPLYPMLCVLVYILSGHSFMAMAIIQALISSFMCVIIYLIAKHLFGDKVAPLAAILIIFHPGIIIYTTKFNAFILDSFFFPLIIWLLIVTKKNPSFINQVKLGLAFGFTMLTRPTILAFMPFSWLWVRRKSRKLLLIYPLIALIVLSPWLIRNYLIYRKIMIVSSSANVFWRGNNPLATGTSLAPSKKPILHEIQGEDQGMISSIYGKSEIEQSRIFWDKSFDFIRKNPLRFVKLTLRKFYYFWWFADTTGSEYRKEWLVIYKILYSFILLSGLVGVIGLKKADSQIKYDVFIIFILMLTIAIVQSFFYVETRHRWVIEPLLLIFTANGLVYTFGKIWPHSTFF